MRKLKASHTPLFTAWPAAHKLSLPGTQGKERDGGQTAGSCNESLAPPVPSSPGSLDPSFRQGDNVCLAVPASFTEKTHHPCRGGWGGGSRCKSCRRRKAQSGSQQDGRMRVSAQQLDGNALLQVFSTNTT